MPRSRQVRQIFSSSSGAISRPVGLLGLHRNTVWQAVFSRTSRNASVTAKPSASDKGTYVAAPPAASRAAAYSEKVGAVSRARSTFAAPQ